MRRVVVVCAFLSLVTGVGSAQESAPVVQDYVVEAIIDVPGSFSTGVFGINSRGQVAGRYNTGPECDAPQIAFVWERGVFEYLSFPGAPSTRADNVNDPGFVTGSFGDNCVPGRDGFVMTPHGEYIEVSFPFSMHEVVNKITPSGWMVGPYVDSDCEWGSLGDGCIHGFLYDGEEFYTLDPPGSRVTDAVDINPRGDVVGYYSDLSGGTHGFVLRAGAYETVDFPGLRHTYLWGITAAGVTVGRAWNDGGEGRVQFIYDRGRFTEINLLADVDFESFAVWNINNQRAIVGGLRGTDGKQRGFVARPAK